MVDAALYCTYERYSCGLSADIYNYLNICFNPLVCILSVSLCSVSMLSFHNICMETCHWNVYPWMFIISVSQCIWSILFHHDLLYHYKNSLQNVQTRYEEFKGPPAKLKGIIILHIYHYKNSLTKCVNKIPQICRTSRNAERYYHHTIITSLNKMIL